MLRIRLARPLVGVALSALVATAFAPSAASAQTPSPAQALPPTLVTPRPASSANPLATPVPNRTPRAAPQSSSAPAGAGGNAGVDARALPSLAPADQTVPLPYPAYGTPAPVGRGTKAVPNVPQVITLQQATLIAYARSPQLASARASVEIASAPVGLAQSALFPAVTGNASTTRAHRESGSTASTGTTTGTSGSFNPNTTTNSLTVGLQQLIFDGGRVAAQIRGARATQSASIATYQRQLQTVAFNVASACDFADAAWKPISCSKRMREPREMRSECICCTAYSARPPFPSGHIELNVVRRLRYSFDLIPNARRSCCVCCKSSTEQLSSATYCDLSP